MSSSDDDFSDSRHYPVKRNPIRGPSSGQSLSIDAILKRTHPSQRNLSSAPLEAVGSRMSALEAAEIALSEKERGLVQLRAEILERERVVRETEMLLNARERYLNDREALLATPQNPASADKRIAALEKSLEGAREALANANDALADKEDFITSLHTEIDALKARLASPEATPAGAKPLSYDHINQPSLADQLAFLREREAFIEQSENTLFDKAQALQEWETRLQQEQHDQDSKNSPPT